MGAGREPAPLYIGGDEQNTPSAEIGPSQDELNSAHKSTRDWLYHTHDYSGARFVQLTQINSDNASGLQVSCVFQVGEIGNFQTGPIVYRGTMYLTTLHLTVALDASNCRPKWRHSWVVKDADVIPTNRGVAIKDGYVVRGTSDGYVFALNAENGKLVWARKLANSAVGETFTMAPLIYEDMVLIGPAGSENAISGWVGAFRLSDGSEIWKFKTVPGADEGGSKTWDNPKDIKLGGGAVWTPFSFDTDKEELYVAVTNPAPDLPIGLRPGKNLYTNSLVALDIRTGNLRWYKQLVPNDSHDWDLTQVSPLFKTKIKGQDRRLVATVGKDGVLRTLDRDSQEVLYETPVTTLKNYHVPVSSEGTLACPGVLGGVEWNGPAFNPGTNMLYVGAVDWCTTFWAAETVRYIPGKLYMGGTTQRTKENQGWVTAIDASSGEVRWKYRSPRPIVSAVTTTSGNVVFTGELTGDFIVLDAKSGEILYRFNTGGPIGGGIITYQLDGKQYLAVMSGRPSRLWVDQNPGAPTVFLFALP
jgi:alcohol dehydrogenase (cytochrome c)